MREQAKQHNPGRKTGAPMLIVNALRLHLDEVEALRQYGLTWEGVTKTLSGTPLFGAVSMRTIRDTHARLRRSGQTADAGRVAQLLGDYKKLFRLRLPALPPAGHSTTPSEAAEQRDTAPNSPPLSTGANSKLVEPALRQVIDDRQILRQRIDERQMNNQPIHACDLAELGFPEWLAKKVSSTQAKLERILPRFLWHIPKDQEPSRLFLREQPECARYLPLLDAGVNSYDAAKKMLADADLTALQQPQKPEPLRDLPQGQTSENSEG